MNIVDDEILDSISQKVKIGFTLEEVAILLKFNVEEFLREAEWNNQVKDAILRGQLLAREESYSSSDFQKAVAIKEYQDKLKELYDI